MSEIIRAETPDGRTFWVRVEGSAGPRDISAGDIKKRLEDLSETLETVVGHVRSGLRRSSPDEVTLEFGIELAVKSGALVSVVTGASGKGTLKVAATWKKDGESSISLGEDADSPEKPVSGL
ncbi:CU044_2847 family protein [Streptomyces gamaensis]|uniref:CU044_2847 family protein n=1 Tax=Streptomyces gamaensis TaxID=1763542 RepID=A0ABW0Z905_9ACTN